MNDLISGNPLSTERLEYLFDYIKMCSATPHIAYDYTEIESRRTLDKGTIEYKIVTVNSVKTFQISYVGVIILGKYINTNYYSDSNGLLIDSVLYFSYENEGQIVSLLELEDPDYMFNIRVLYPENVLVMIGALWEISKKYNSNFTFNDVILCNFLEV